MASMQEKVLGIIAEKARSLGYETVKAAKWANSGTLHLERPGKFGPVASVAYDFQSGYFNVTFSSP